MRLRSRRSVNEYSQWEVFSCHIDAWMASTLCLCAYVGLWLNTAGVDCSGVTSLKAWLSLDVYASKSKCNWIESMMTVRFSYSWRHNIDPIFSPQPRSVTEYNQVRWFKCCAVLIVGRAIVADDLCREYLNTIIESAAQLMYVHRGSMNGYFSIIENISL